MYIYRPLAAVVSDVLPSAFHLQRLIPHYSTVQDTTLFITDIDRCHINGAIPIPIVNSNNKQTNKTTSPP
jgi:hypothetical protein